MVRWINNPPGLWFPNCWIYAGFVELVGSDSNKLYVSADGPMSLCIPLYYIILIYNIDPL